MIESVGKSDFVELGGTLESRITIEELLYGMTLPFTLLIWTP